MDIEVVIAELVSTITDLTDEQTIVARANYLQADFKSNLAVIESLLNTPISRSITFDGDNETLTYTTYRSSQITIDFYGDDALTNVNTFEAKLRGQASYEYCRDNEIEIYNNKTVQNIKNIQGTTVYNRFQLEIVVKYNEVINEDVLRIDTAQMKVYTDTGKVYDIETPDEI